MAFLSPNFFFISKSELETDSAKPFVHQFQSIFGKQHSSSLYVWLSCENQLLFISSVSKGKKRQSYYKAEDITTDQALFMTVCVKNHDEQFFNPAYLLPTSFSTYLWNESLPKQTARAYRLLQSTTDKSCTYIAPGLLCKNRTNKVGYGTKLISIASDANELRINTLLEQIDPAQNFFIYLIPNFLCGEKITSQQLATCKAPKPLWDYQFKDLPSLTHYFNSLAVVSQFQLQHYIRACMELIQGIQLLHSFDIAHLNITLSTIVWGTSLPESDRQEFFRVFLKDFEYAIETNNWTSEQLLYSLKSKTLAEYPIETLVLFQLQANKYLEDSFGDFWYRALEPTFPKQFSRLDIKIITDQYRTQHLTQNKEFVKEALVNADWYACFRILSYLWSTESKFVTDYANHFGAIWTALLPDILKIRAALKTALHPNKRYRPTRSVVFDLFQVLYDRFIILTLHTT